jgi:hypothetical protein
VEAKVSIAPSAFPTSGADLTLFLLLLVLLQTPAAAASYYRPSIFAALCCPLSRDPWPLPRDSLRLQSTCLCRFHSTKTPRARVPPTIACLKKRKPATNRPFLQNNPNPHQQGLPPPQLQHPRQAGLIQQHRPNSPLQPHGIHHTSQAPYLSPHSSTHSLAQHHSPYVGSVPSLPSQHSAEPNYFTAQPSPYSANSAAGSYASSGTPPPSPSSLCHIVWYSDCPCASMHNLCSLDDWSDVFRRTQRQHGCPSSDESATVSAHLELPDSPVQLASIYQFATA